MLRQTVALWAVSLNLRVRNKCEATLREGCETTKMRRGKGGEWMPGYVATGMSVQRSASKHTHTHRRRLAAAARRRRRGGQGFGLFQTEGQPR